MEGLDASGADGRFPVRCERCEGSGWIVYEGGAHPTQWYMRGQLVTGEVEASPERPVYRKCKCRLEEPRVAPVVSIYE